MFDSKIFTVVIGVTLLAAVATVTFQVLEMLAYGIF